MSHRPSFLVRFLLFTLPLCLAAVLVDAAAPPQFKAGAATANITPPIGGDIVGGFHPFPSKHIHDDLHARCLVLDNGETRVAFVVCDLIGLSRYLCDEARRVVHEETGLPSANLMMAGTHTHSATSALGERYSTSTELNDYQKFVARRIADVVRCAINNLAPAQVGWAAGSEPRHVFNRRWFMKPGTVPVTPFGGTNDLVKMNPPRANANLVKPAGPTDPEICFVAVRRPDGKPLGLLANYSLHYVGGVGPAHISADYYGMFCDRIQQLLGADDQDPPFVAMMSNGTSGNINNIDFTKPGEKMAPYEKMRIVANDVAAAVHKAYQTIQWRDTAALGGMFRELDIKFRHPTPEQLERAKGVLAKLKPGAKPNTLEEIYADRTLKVAGYPKKGQIPIQAIRVGDVGIGTIPTEVFVEIGLEMKKRSPLKPAFVVSLAHGYFGYLPTPEQHKLGGYETWLGTNRLEPETSPKIVAALLEMLDQLKAGVKPAPEPKVELLWPKGAPGALGSEDLDKPTLSIWLPPAGKANGAAVVICPGGGYGHLAVKHEGADVAAWLNARGVAAFMLKYRLGPRYHHPAPMLDVQRALRTVRARAAEWGVDPKRIGVWGFSAGGHLASTAGTHFDDGNAGSDDKIERASCRPDFMILAYPVISMETGVTHNGSRRNLLGEEPDPKLVELMSNDKQVTKRTPPAFLFHTKDDAGVPVENAIRFHTALQKANVPAEIQLYDHGRHGVGLAPNDPALSTWPEKLEAWLKARGFLSAKP